MYSKEEVVELFNEFHQENTFTIFNKHSNCNVDAFNGHEDLEQFFKEKGLIEEQFEVGWYVKEWDDGDFDLILVERFFNTVFDSVRDCHFRNGKILKEANHEGSQEYIDTRFNFRKATPKEVEEALIKVWCRKTGKGFYNYQYNSKTNTFEVLPIVPNGDTEWEEVFKDGKWAEIVEDNTEKPDDVETAPTSDEKLDIMFTKMSADFEAKFNDSVLGDRIETIVKKILKKHKLLPKK